MPVSRLMPSPRGPRHAGQSSTATKGVFAAASLVLRSARCVERLRNGVLPIRGPSFFARTYSPAKAPMVNAPAMINVRVTIRLRRAVMHEV